MGRAKSKPIFEDMRKAKAQSSLCVREVFMCTVLVLKIEFIAF